jgi:hypothetical protein
MWSFYLIIIIITIRHQFGRNITVAVSCDSLFKGLPNHFHPFDLWLQHYFMFDIMINLNRFEPVSSFGRCSQREFEVSNFSGTLTSCVAVTFCWTNSFFVRFTHNRYCSLYLLCCLLMVWKFHNWQIVSQYLLQTNFTLNNVRLNIVEKFHIYTPIPQIAKWQTYCNTKLNLRNYKKKKKNRKSQHTTVHCSVLSAEPNWQCRRQWCWTAGDLYNVGIQSYMHTSRT